MTVYGFQSKSVANRLADSVGGTEVGDGLNAFGQNWLFLIPAGGIPGMTGTTPGTADCVPYFIKTDGTLTEWTNNAGASVAVPVFNVSEAKATEGLYMPGFMVGNQAVINPAGVTAEQICASLCLCNNTTSVDPALCEIRGESELTLTISGFVDCGIADFPNNTCNGFKYSQLNGTWKYKAWQNHPEFGQYQEIKHNGETRIGDNWDFKIGFEDSNGYSPDAADWSVALHAPPGDLSGSWSWTLGNVIDGMISEGTSLTLDSPSGSVSPAPAGPSVNCGCAGDTTQIATFDYEFCGNNSDYPCEPAAPLAGPSILGFGDQFFADNRDVFKGCGGCARDVIALLNKRPDAFEAAARVIVSKNNSVTLAEVVARMQATKDKQ